MPTTTTYYTSCSPIITGCYLYLNSNYTGPVPAGYYSDGIHVYQVTGTLGKVTSISNCSTTTQAPCTNCCFVANTIISLVDGNVKAINDIIPGDSVLSFNEDKKIVEPNKVLSVRSKSSKNLIRYNFANDSKTECTDDHPFYVNGYNIASFNPLVTKSKYGFKVDVNQINIGDTVNLVDGTHTYIKSIDILSNEEQVYTFEVENNHNYYANGVLVHNKEYGPICCYNTVTYQVLSINNAGGAHSGCCCLGPNWVAATASECGF
jgi:hypothetical protein